MSSTVQCPQCQRNVKPLPPLHVCPYCGAKIPKLFVPEQPPEDDAIELEPEEPALPPPVRSVAPVQPIGMPPPPPPPPVAPTGPAFPERMKANKILAGRVCPGCAKEIDLGDEVYNCQSCNGTMHYACYDAAKCCKNPSCPTALELVSLQKPKHGGIGGISVPQKRAPINLDGATGPDGTKPCPYCGESILASAKKCRFCNEYLNAADRDRKAKLTMASAADDDLSTVEIVFGILCGLIACIVGIVWMIQGKKKGGKLVLLVIVANIILQGLKFLLTGTL